MFFEDLLVEYEGWDSGPPSTDVIVDFEEVTYLAEEAKYEDGIAHLDIEQDARFGTCRVKLMVHKVSMSCIILWSPRLRNRTAISI